MKDSLIFLESYKLEILWFGVLTLAFRLIYDYLKRRTSRDYIRIQKQEAITLYMKPKIDWFMAIVSLIFGISGVIIAVIGFIENDLNKAFHSIGILSTLVLTQVVYYQRRLFIQQREKSLIVNNIEYAASALVKIELWDDLIFFETLEGKNVKLWLKFKAKHYPTALDIIKLIHEFCKQHNIPIENNFAKDIKQNEVFNQ